VEIGARLVGDAGQRLEDIAAQVRQVIERLAEAQADSLVAALARPFEPVQPPAQLLTESAAAADSLRAQAARMARAVSVFRLDAGASVRG
jgi:methyl-accepting chemotaxis protein